MNKENLIILKKISELNKKLVDIQTEQKNILLFLQEIPKNVDFLNALKNKKLIDDLLIGCFIPHSPACDHIPCSKILEIMNLNNE